MGGAMYVEDLLRPMPFLQVLPQGNVKLEEVPDYIKAGVNAKLTHGTTSIELTGEDKQQN